MNTSDHSAESESVPIDSEEWQLSRSNVVDPARLKRATTAVKRVQRTFLGTDQPAPKGDGDLPGLAGRIIDCAGSLSGKYDPPLSLSTHLINTVVTGLNAYVYDTVVRAGESPDGEQAKLLMAALALHDANKYVDQAYDLDIDTKYNTEEVLTAYFEQGDDFGLCEVLPGETKEELAQDIRDVKWLVQRTETSEDSRATRGQATDRARPLVRYCQIGDGFASEVGNNGVESAMEWLAKFFSSAADEQLHLLSFTELEQPILNNDLLSVVKAAVRGNSDVTKIDHPPQGIILGTTPDTVAYLGNPVDRGSLQTLCRQAFMGHVATKYEFSCKTEWRSFDPDILTEVGIPLEEKREIIADGYAETLKRGSGTNHEFESIPDWFRNHIPDLAQLIFAEKTYEEAFESLSELPRLKQQIWESSEYNTQTRKIGFLAELLRRVTESVDDGYDPDTLRAELEIVSERVSPRLEAILEPDTVAGVLVVNRFFDGSSQTTPQRIPSSADMCFLCGREATQAYQKGSDGFYGTNKFSRRVTPEGKYKHICPVCNLEHALLRHTCEGHDLSADEDIQLAFVYYDAFVAGVSLADPIKRDLTSYEDGFDTGQPMLVARSLEPQYHLQPFYAPDENSRLGATSQFLQNLVGKGMKVTIGKPFTRFQPTGALFTDLSPTRRQTAFGSARIESFDELSRVNTLFEIIRQVGGNSETIDESNVYLIISSDSFHQLADITTKETEWYADVRAQAHEYFLTNYEDQYMKMRTVARRGLELYGPQFDSQYKKTKIFRQAIDATLDGLNRQMSEEELHEHVAGQVYKSAQNEKYAPGVTTGAVEEFVTQLFKFLREDSGLNIETLSRRRNTLTNTYLFAYDQLLNERRTEQAEN